jgi:catechol 2,3-dioxygenase-like lactoylglutathione lyase family enzyme
MRVRRSWRQHEAQKPVRNNTVTEEWYARPVLFVADVDRTLDFYVNRLGFTQSWRFEDGGKAQVAQADRQGCALTFSSLVGDSLGSRDHFSALRLQRGSEKPLYRRFVGRGGRVICPGQAA